MFGLPGVRPPFAGFVGSTCCTEFEIDPPQNMHLAYSKITGSSYKRLSKPLRNPYILKPLLDSTPDPLRAGFTVSSSEVAYSGFRVYGAVHLCLGNGRFYHVRFPSQFETVLVMMSLLAPDKE